jgi:uncharacterized protein DUF3105
MTTRYALLLLAALASACGSGTPSTPAPTPSGAPGMAVPNEGWLHVPEGFAVTYISNPPASGPHYPVWLRWEEYSATMPRGYWVHNLEHGGIVFLYRPDAPGNVIAEHVAAYRALPNDPLCGHKRALITPDPQLPWPAAVVAANFVLRAENTSQQVIHEFALARRGHGPEQICDQGTRP